MSTRTTTTRRLLAALSTPLVMAGLVVAPAATAQAHDNIWVDEESRNTDDCGCYLPDEYDGTYFEYDAGGLAYKGEIYSGHELVGKVEFHPKGEKVGIYDTKANGDGLYFAVKWREDGRLRAAHSETPSGGYMKDLDIDDGTIVTVYVWDDGFYSDDSELLVGTGVA